MQENIIFSGGGPEEDKFTLHFFNDFLEKTRK